MDKLFENNRVTMVGKIVSDFRFSHQIYGENFYIADIEAPRFSGNVDCIPVMISERMMNVKEECTGMRIHVDGQLRSFNRHDGKKNRLLLSVFARKIEFMDEMQDNLECNQIHLDGYICKEPIYRKTPLGREIADFMVAVNRSYGKTDYIPCICWGRNARFASDFEVGSHVQVKGRIQSREYVKKLSETESEIRTAYEVSASKIELLADR